MRRVVAVSAALHLVAFACILQLKPPPARVAPPAPHEEEVAIEIDEPIERAAATATETPRGEAPVAMVERAARPVEAAPTAATAAPEADAPPDTAPFASNGTLIVLAPNVGLGGPNAANPFLMRGALPAASGGGGEGERPKAAPSADPFYVPENKRAEQAVKDALRARDQSIGLGLEGPVVHALEDATHSGFAPERGTAMFMAVIDERGLVIDLEVLGTPHDAGWDDVRARAVKSLARAKIDLRGVKRAELKIEVTSDVLMASGSDPKHKVVATGDRKQAVIETNAPGSPSGADVVETREVSRFDVTDLASKPTRVVHAKLVMLVTR